jgi:hypothetical protein
MHFQTARADVIRAIGQCWLAKTWNERRGRRALPTWQNLEGREFASISRHLCFLDVVGDPAAPRFLMRHHSDWLREVYGFDCHGKYLDEMPSGQFQNALIATYRHAVTTRKPVYASVDLLDRSQTLVHYERLLLPFGQDGETVDRILASLEMVSPDGAFDHRNLMAGSTRPSSFAVYASIQYA